MQNSTRTIYECIDGGDTAEPPHRTEYAKAYDAGCLGYKCIKLVLDAIRDWANVYYLIIKKLYGEVLINNT